MDHLYAPLRDDAAQQARLDKAMRAPVDMSPSSDDAMQIEFGGDEPPTADEFFEFCADLAAAGKTLLVWMLVVIACLLAAVAIATLGG